MKGLALVAAGVLVAGAAARADNPTGAVAVVNGEEIGPTPASQSFTYLNIITRVDESPPGRLLFGVGANPQKPDLEQGLDEIQKKLDRILKELEGLKWQPRAAKPQPFTFYIGAFW